MDAIERFAADVAHEIKNPLTSIRSAIETLRRIEDAAKRRNLLAIIAEDVMRLDRLISDISDASRVDAEISRVTPVRLDIVAMLGALADIDDATRAPGAPMLVLGEVKPGIGVAAVEGRLVQVLAQSDRQCPVLQPVRRPHRSGSAGNCRRNGRDQRCG